MPRTRPDCPPERQLSEFCVGLLADDDQIDVIGQHIDECRHCRSYVEGEPTFVDYHDSIATQYATEVPQHVLESRIIEFGRESIPETIGKYRIEGVVDRGGMSTVYRAQHPSLKRTVAVKSLSGTCKLSEQSRWNLIREQQTLGQIRHPSIVSVMDADLDNGIPFIVMEYVNGRNLAETVRHSGPLNAVDACAVLAAVCDALATVHDAGYIHRDVKPGNIMLSQDGVPKLLDLGLAIQTSDERPLTGGTPRFIAPEQALGTPDRRADLYGVGASFLFLVSGQLPPEINTPDRDTQIQLHLKGAPASIRRLVTNLLETDPDLRPCSALEVRDRFAKLGMRSYRVDLRNAVGVAVSRSSGWKHALLLGMAVSLLTCFATLFWTSFPNRVRQHAGHLFFADSIEADTDLPGLLMADQIRVLDKQLNTAYPRPYPKNAVWDASGKHIACFGDDGALRIYDVVGGGIQNVRLLPCFHDSDVDMPQIRWINENRVFVAASIRDDLQIWDLTDQVLVHSIAHQEEVLDTAWDPNHQCIAIADGLGRVRLYSPDAALIGETGQLLKGRLTSLAFDANGERLAVLSELGEICILAVHGLDVVVSGNLETQSQCLAWRPNDDHLYVGNDSGTVFEVDVSSDVDLVAQHKLGRGVVASLQWNQNGEMLAVGSWDTVVWNPHTGNVHELIQSTSYNGASVDWSDQKLVLASYDQGLTVWDAETQKTRVLLESSLQQVISIAWNPFRSEAAISTMSGNVFVIDSDGTLLWHDDPNQGNIAVGSLQWSPDGSHLCGVSEWQSELYVWNAESHQRDATIRAHEGILSAVWLSDNHLLSGGDSGVLQWFALDTLSEVGSCHIPGRVRDLSFDRKRNRVAAAVSEGGVFVLAFSEDDQARLQHHLLDADSVRGVAWSPDAQRLGVSTSEGNIYLLDADSFEVQRVLEDPALRPQRLQWNPSGSAIAVGDSGVFDATTLRRNSAVPIRCYAFDWAGNEDHLIAGTWIGTVGCFSVNSGERKWNLVLHRSGVTTKILNDGTVIGPRSDRLVTIRRR